MYICMYYMHRHAHTYVNNEAFTTVVGTLPTPNSTVELQEPMTR